MSQASDQQVTCQFANFVSSCTQKWGFRFRKAGKSTAFDNESLCRIEAQGEMSAGFIFRGGKLRMKRDFQALEVRGEEDETEYQQQ